MKRYRVQFNNFQTVFFSYFTYMFLNQDYLIFPILITIGPMYQSWKISRNKLKKHPVSKNVYIYTTAPGLEIPSAFSLKFQKSLLITIS